MQGPQNGITVSAPFPGQTISGVVKPTTAPVAERTNGSTKNCSAMSDFFAPSARRIPISPVRSLTVASILFTVPIPPTKRDIAAILPNTKLSYCCVALRCSQRSNGMVISKSRFSWVSASRLSIAAAVPLTCSSAFPQRSTGSVLVSQRWRIRGELPTRCAVFVERQIISFAERPDGVGSVTVGNKVLRRCPNQLTPNFYRKFKSTNCLMATIHSTHLFSNRPHFQQPAKTARKISYNRQTPPAFVIIFPSESSERAHDRRAS